MTNSGQGMARRGEAGQGTARLGTQRGRSDAPFFIHLMDSYSRQGMAWHG